MKWLDLIKTAAPYILMFIPGLPPALVPAIVRGISDAETIPGATGPQKKAAVLDMVATTMATVNTVEGKTVVDPVALAGVVGQGIDTAVDAINLIHSAQTPVAPAA